MIELPDFAHMASAVPVFQDAGFTQRGIQSLERIDRKGARFKMACAYGPYPPEQGRVMVARLIAGKQEGIRIELPILHNQGSPGSPRLSAAVTTGKVIQLENLTPGYFCKEGYFLSLVKDGRHYLHSVRSAGMASGAGTLTVTLNEMLRNSFPDETPVHLAKPMIEGFVEGDEWAWSLSVDRVIPIEFAIEEAR